VIRVIEQARLPAASRTEHNVDVEWIWGATVKIEFLSATLDG
jgi:hypothetical protein